MMIHKIRLPSFQATIAYIYTRSYSQPSFMLLFSATFVFHEVFTSRVYAGNGSQVTHPTLFFSE